MGPGGGLVVVEIVPPVVEEIGGLVVGARVEHVPIADTWPSQHSINNGFKVFPPQHDLTDDEYGNRVGYSPQHWSFFSLSICPIGTHVSSLLNPAESA